MNQPAEPYNKLHLSPSRINRYNTCSQQYKYHYVDGMRTTYGFPVFRGIVFDEMMNAYCKHKMKTGEDLPFDQVIKFFNEMWDSKQARFDFGEELEDGDPKKIDLNAEYVIAARAVEFWHNTVAPSLRPAGIQVEYKVKREGKPFDLLMYADLITDDCGIVDNKIKAKSPSKDPRNEGNYLPGSYSHYLQMMLYDYGYFINIGEYPEYLRLDYLVPLKTKTNYCPAQWTPDSEDRRYIQYMIETMEGGIANSQFTPNRGGMTCTKKYCGFWQVCQEEFGGKVKD